jgi:hypothetical protein
MLKNDTTDGPLFDFYAALESSAAASALATAAGDLAADSGSSSEELESDSAWHTPSAAFSTPGTAAQLSSNAPVTLYLQPDHYPFADDIDDMSTSTAADTIKTAASYRGDRGKPFYDWKRQTRNIVERFIMNRRPGHAVSW